MLESFTKNIASEVTEHLKNEISDIKDKINIDDPIEFTKRKGEGDDINDRFDMRGEINNEFKKIEDIDEPIEFTKNNGENDNTNDRFDIKSKHDNEFKKIEDIDEPIDIKMNYEDFGQDIDKCGMKIEKVDRVGGAYKDLINNENPKTNKHHIPAKSAYLNIPGYRLDKETGPCIKIEEKDHQKCASSGASKEAKEWQLKQNELIKQGKFEEAVQMDIDDIRDKFGNKYDEAINQMLEYIKDLKKDGVI